jgi:hypothetical protein
VLVSVHHGFSAGGDLLAYWNDEGSCASDEIEVLTFKFSEGIVASNQVAFSVVVL